MTLLKRDYSLATTEVDRLADQTRAGMAHFGGTGPDGATCDSCAFFRREHFGKKSIFGRPPSGHCAKHAELMRKQGPKFPGSARACRYYEVRS